MEKKATGSREMILKASRELFWKHGFRRVTVEEICERSGISKMTFYRYFKNKTDLARKVFDKVVEEAFESFRSIMNEESPGEAKIRKILLLKFEGTHDISEEFLTDFYSDKETGLKEYVQVKSHEIWQEIITELKSAQQKGLFRDDVNFEFLFYVSRKLSEMISDPAVGQFFAKPQEVVMELANLMMYGILPRSKTK